VHSKAIVPGRDGGGIYALILNEASCPCPHPKGREQGGKKELTSGKGLSAPDQRGLLVAISVGRISASRSNVTE